MRLFACGPEDTEREWMCRQPIMVPETAREDILCQLSIVFDTPSRARRAEKSEREEISRL